jgi:hypothetical protein
MTTAKRRILPPLTFYHVTTETAAARILEQGFGDAVSTYLTSSLHRGVWVSDAPLNMNEGAKGDTVLELRLSCSNARIAHYEWIEEGKPYRERLLPAKLINTCGRVRVVCDTEDDA